MKLLFYFIQKTKIFLPSFDINFTFFLFAFSFNAGDSGAETTTNESVKLVSDLLGRRAPPISDVFSID